MSYLSPSLCGSRYHLSPGILRRCLPSPSLPFHHPSTLSFHRLLGVFGSYGDQDGGGFNCGHKRRRGSFLPTKHSRESAGWLSCCSCCYVETHSMDCLQVERVNNRSPHSSALVWRDTSKGQRWLFTEELDNSLSLLCSTLVLHYGGPRARASPRAAGGGDNGSIHAIRPVHGHQSSVGLIIFLIIFPPVANNDHHHRLRHMVTKSGGSPHQLPLCFTGSVFASKDRGSLVLLLFLLLLL